ncbi:MAG: hypothetical protein V3R71_04085 [Gemmatimonadales bacterium]
MTTPTAELVSTPNAVQEFLREVSKALTEKHDSPGTPPATGYAHGSQGVWSYPGVDERVFSTIVGNRAGVSTALPIVGSLRSDPLFEVFTGIRAATGSQPDDHCDDGPVAGLSKAGKLSAPFGEYHMATQELRIDRLALHNDRADPLDLTLVGSPLTETPFAMEPAPTPQTSALRSTMAMNFQNRAVAMHRLLSQQTFAGNPANNPGAGGSAEFAGLDLLINTGHVDAVTNTPLPSIDSDLKDFNYAKVEDNGSDLVTALSELFRYVRNNAETMGYLPVRWVFAMRRSAFIQITGVWPCSYFLGGCSQADAGLNLMLQAESAREMRDDMRNNNYLLIDGERIDVLIDDGIPEETTADSGNVTEGCFASDIYLIPMSVLGGQSVTFWEYQAFQNAEVVEAIGRLGPGVRIEGGGQFLDWSKRTNLCVQWEFQINPRIIMRTPWLAGRLQNVMYCPLQHEREAFPDDPYFVDGGASSTTGPSYFAPWKS